MKRRVGATVVVAVAIVVGAVGCSPGRSAPDVVLITIDTLRADRLGCYGNGDGLTPTLDRIARRGVLFGDATAAVPVTLPSHASLMTGRYPTAHGVRNNGTFVVPDDEITLAERLREAGWRTAAVVASYPLDERYGLGQGFERYDDEFPRPDVSGKLQLHFPERRADAVTDRAIAAWESLGEGPRFLWVHYFDPHAPYAPPDPWLERHGERRYDGEVAYVDSEIGRLLEAIGGGGRDPILVVTSDHGESLGEHDEKTHGVFVYQSTMHVPLIVAGGGVWRGGRRVEGPVSLVDVVPTVLGMLGLEPHAGLHGVDLGPLLASGVDPSRAVYGESFLPRLSFRFSELRMTRRGALKYIDAPAPELYDLGQDPGETRNLSGGHPDERELVAELEAFVDREDEGAARRASGSLDAEASARLRSLGYVAGGTETGGSDLGGGRDPKTMTAYIRRHDQALGLLSQGDLDGGLEALEQLREEAPENWVLPFQMAGGLISAGRLGPAEVLLREVIAEAPEFESGYLMLAEVQAKLGDYVESARNYDAAAAIQWWAAEPLFQKGRMLLDAGRFDAAAEAFLEAIRREPSSSEPIAALIDLRESRGDLEAAIHDLEVIIETHPSAVELHVGLARAMRRAGDLDGARGAAAEAVRLAPSAAEPHRESGEIGLLTGDPVAAERHFEAALEAEPGSLSAHFGVARAIALQGRTVEAESRFAAILKQDPEFAAVLSFQGRMREQAGEPRRAAVLYRRALQIDPSDRGAWQGMERLRASQER